MRLTICTAVALAMTSAAVPAAAETAPPRFYDASYKPARDVYCLRLYSDGQVADPRPNVRGMTCRAKSAWAQEGVFIEHRRGVIEVAAR